ncbi:MAG: carbamoyltransferase HypF [Acidobacteria bacterium]|nr:carbamoyltransferase HypF [Acidobacteriota bacterium]
MYDAAASKRSAHIGRLRIAIRGAVQGVGFRPFVYRLANELRLKGFVKNSPRGVLIEVEGNGGTIDQFLLRIPRELPPRSFIQSLESTHLDAIVFSDFRIEDSDEEGVKKALVLPDVATCPDCLEDVLNPENRRYRYPFTNCTNCGPRYSMIRSLPYDRRNTTMARFEMCAECLAEYDDPLDRRFHAQPNACPECGPQLELWDAEGKVTATRGGALIAAADAVRKGSIVAVKGLGGFHLICDAANDKAVQELRLRKRREEKPLALMCPSIEFAMALCSISDLERRLLTSPEAPIVLLTAKKDAKISSRIAPGNPYLGVMLPYTPLHHLLTREVSMPVVATSGNLSDEPMCIDENEAIERLGGVADAFLVHDRPIERHVDDSIVRVMAGREMVLRRARGFAPLPFEVRGAREPIVAAGAHLKNTVALAKDGDAFVSQHIGDLETKEAFDAFGRVIKDVEHLYDIRPSIAACDMHPEYISTKWADRSGLRSFPVQHHYAHVLACMTENEVHPPVLGIAWDGTGYGSDGTIWGGEFLSINETGFERAAHLRTFRLPGGDSAVRDPRRTALGLLYELLGEKLFERKDLFPVVSFSDAELNVLRKMLSQCLNSPLTSSAGRLFDAVAAILGLRKHCAFEGQAAMELEFLARDSETSSYELRLVKENGSPIIVDWEPMILSLLSDINCGIPAATTAARFHNSLVEMIAAVASECGTESIVLTGGCFQNRYLLEHSVKRLRKDAFKVYWHQRIPTNDGGISLGQIAAAVRADQE